MNIQNQGSTLQTIGIPVLNRPDLLLRCVDSIDYPLQTLLILNNSPDLSAEGICGFIEKRRFFNAHLFKEIRVEKNKNLGCAASWNRIMTSCPGAWALVQSDLQFLPGTLREASVFLSQNPDADALYASNIHGHMGVITESGFKKIGLFDENFYPGYFEDEDYKRRAALTGATVVRLPEFRAVHGEPPLWRSSTLNSDPCLQEKMNVIFPRLLDYYIQKWGGCPGKEVFLAPFGKDVPPSFWEIDHILREKNSIF